jgi:hypothetical protein
MNFKIDTSKLDDILEKKSFIPQGGGAPMQGGGAPMPPMPPDQGGIPMDPSMMAEMAGGGAMDPAMMGAPPMPQGGLPMGAPPSMGPAMMGEEGGASEQTASGEELEQIEAAVDEILGEGGGQEKGEGSKGLEKRLQRIESKLDEVISVIRQIAGPVSPPPSVEGPLPGVEEPPPGPGKEPLGPGEAVPGPPQLISPPQQDSGNAQMMKVIQNLRS